jgi:hypothetical protein
MRAAIDGNGVEIDLISNSEDVLKVARLALQAGLSDILIGRKRDGFTVGIRPRQDAFAADPLAGMLAVVAEVQGTTPEVLVEQWRAKAGAIAA